MERRNELMKAEVKRLPKYRPPPDDRKNSRRYNLAKTNRMLLIIENLELSPPYSISPQYKLSGAVELQSQLLQYYLPRYDGFISISPPKINPNGSRIQFPF